MKVLVARCVELNTKGEGRQCLVRAAAFRDLEKTCQLIIADALLGGDSISLEKADGEHELFLWVLKTQNKFKHRRCFESHCGRLPVIHAAAESGAAALVRCLVENGTNVDAMNIFGLTPLGTLNTKSQNYPTECKMQLLLECGANTEAMDEMENRILSGASSPGFANVAFLLDHEAKIGARNVTGTTALHKAACQGQVSTLSVLLDRGADI